MDHAMATGKEAGQHLLDRLVLADNYLLDFPDDCLPSGLETFKSGLEIRHWTAVREWSWELLGLTCRWRAGRREGGKAGG